MDGRTKVTREVLCEESRFILANVLAEARYGRQNRYEDIRRVCEAAVTIPFSEYVGFLEAAGYMRHDETEGRLEVTAQGEEIVNGGNLAELTLAAVSHFKNARIRRRNEASVPGESLGGPPPPPAGRVAANTIGRARGQATDSRHASSAPSETRYEKLGAIGSGGVGTVYRARQIGLGRVVALKEIRELFGFFADDQRVEIHRRFVEVVRQAATLSHPTILPIHDVDLDREHPFVVSELAVNGSARRLIAHAGSLPISVALRFLIDTLHALRAAHAAGIIHRGLKPENLLIDAHGNVRVADFGFSRVVERDPSVIRQVYVGMGAVAYMAPELFVDPSSVAVQTDIYALGIIFYELLTRKLPGRRSRLPSEVVPGVPKGLDDIFDTMTQDARSDRYATVDDVLEDLDKIGGLRELLGDSGNLVLAGDPLAGVTFREGAPAPLAEEAAPDVVTGGSSGPASPGAGGGASGSGATASAAADASADTDGGAAASGNGASTGGTQPPPVPGRAASEVAAADASEEAPGSAPLEVEAGEGGDDDEPAPNEDVPTAGSGTGDRSSRRS